MERDRLRARLVSGFGDGASVGLVCAPAGSGKTTVLTSFLDGFPPEQVAWLGIDGYDNEPARFWSHLIAGLRATPAGPTRFLWPRLGRVIGRPW